MVREQHDSLPRDGENGPCFRRGATALVFLAPLFFASAIAAQTALYVDGSAAGADDGSNWCDAFVYLQDALAAARASGGQVAEIRVGGGAYRPDRGGGTSLGDRTAAFELIDGVALRGGYAGCSAPDPDARDIKVHLTTLTGDLLGDDVASEFPGGPSFGDNSYHVLSGAGADGAVVEGFTITAGHADGVSPHDNGGALYIELGSPTLQRCSLVGNFAAHGGAIHNNGGTLALIDCLLAGNAAGSWGGALDNFSARATLVNCLLVGNTATGEGGAIHSDLSTLTVTNSTLASNTAGNRGGGVFNYAGVLSMLTNDIVWGNRDGSGGGEPAQIFSNPSNQAVVNHTCVEGWTGSFGGVGNLAADPLFRRAPSPGADGVWNGVDDDYGDLRLQPTSGSIDAGDNTADTDAFEPGVQPLPMLDHEGNPRIVNRTVDLGAFEEQAGVQPIPALSRGGLLVLALLIAMTGAALVALHSQLRFGKVR
jgi:predicted outer membrane repeat protein